MTTPVRLSDLLTMLSAAFDAGQTAGEEANIANLRRYLHADGTPRTLSVELPGRGSGDSSDESALEIPLLALIQPARSRLHRLALEIPEIAVEVDVDETPDGVGLQLVRGGSGTGRLLIEIESEVRRAEAEVDGRDAAPDDDFVFSVTSRLVGEHRIDVHEEVATLLVTVGVEATTGEERWDIEDATLILDTAELPNTIRLAAANASWVDGGLAIGLGPLRPGDRRELRIQVTTGIFTGGQSAAPGDYAVPASIRARLRSHAAHEIDHHTSIVLQVAED